VQVAILPPPTQVDFLFILNCLIDLIFIADMVLQFFLMYPQKTNTGIRWEHRKSKIAIHYLTTWFIIDLISIVPFDLVGFFSSSEAVGQVKVVKLIRLLRLLKLAKMFRSFTVSSNFSYACPSHMEIWPCSSTSAFY